VAEEARLESVCCESNQGFESLTHRHSRFFVFSSQRRESVLSEFAPDGPGRQPGFCGLKKWRDAFERQMVVCLECCEI
jgi:hypothetical protein